MFGTIGLIISAIGALKSLKDIFWSKKKPTTTTAPSDCPDAQGTTDGQKFPNGCDAPICRNPAHQHEKDLKAAIDKCRKKRFF